MNNQAISIVETDKPLTAEQMQAQVNSIQYVMKQVMLEDVHYGKIPGTKTPSLYKPGAEKIMATFRLAPEVLITNLGDGDQVRYQVKVRLISFTGAFVGEGIGECSSNEEKYKWRSAICNEEFDSVEPSRRREKWNKGKYNKFNRSYGSPYQVKQIRTDPADLANTVLKMAKKRALIDAVLTATAASDCFTQDIEDLPAEYFDQDQESQNFSQNKEKTEPAFYSETEFQKNLPKWSEMIKSGKTSPDRVIAMVSSKFKLSEDHIKEIKGLAQ